MTALTIANVFYVGCRIVGADQARLAVRQCLAALEIVGIDQRTLVQADALKGSDFEDNIQIAAATIGAVDAIVTRDPTGFAGSQVPVLTPPALVAQLAAPEMP